jgi:hypothetical protein
MALTVTQLFGPIQLAASVAVLYTMPTSPATSVLKNGRVRLTNTSMLAVPVTMHAAPSATASSAANCCLSTVSIPAGGYLDVDIPTLIAGDTLRGFAGTASVVTMHELGGVIYS